MKSPLRVFSALALLAFSGVGLVSCGGNGEPAETTSEDSRSFNIWFDDELSANSSNVEITKGSRYLLWQHVSVPEGTYVLEARTDNVKIDKHVIQALDYGDFRVTIRATGPNNRTITRSISGKVISEEKAEFNQKWETMKTTNRYRVESEIANTVIHLGDNAYEYLAGSNSKTGSDVYGGAVYDGSHWYSYSYDVTSPSDLEFDPGYGLAQADFKTEAGLAGVENFNWVEITDEDGASTGKFYLEDSIEESNNYLYSNTLDPLFTNFVSEVFGNWVTLTRNHEVKGMIAELDGDGIKIVPALDSATPFESLDGEDTSVYLSDIGTAANADLEAWLKSPVYPEAVDISKLQQAFRTIENEKNYTITTQGVWVNPSTGYVASAPEGSEETFAPFSSTTMVDGELKVNIVGQSSTDQVNFLNMSGLDSYLLGGDYSIPETGTVTATYVKDNKLHQAKGTISEKNVITYGTPVEGTSEVTSLWGHATDEDGKHLGYTAVSEGIADLLPYVSFSASSKSGSTLSYSFNTCGEDQSTDQSAENSLILVTWSDGQKFGGIGASIYTQESDCLALNMKEIFNYLFGTAGNEFYITTYFSISGDTISMVEILPYSSSAYYVMETDWSNIGATYLDKASYALLD